ncbi:sugar-binding transcriptional regulator [Oceanomicrobium pacificus]|uniref:Sugar-binding transcriptional regulator n=1 Tax=Oceanomicrobium pacificus TaxID=2692916 RepID=A0A6B0TT32_9RHOB|nr:sugar-binding transcriptional regulator [Oceanomicrobium pacificus]MXU64382.1 sugar-binding transcriptional regulator [Oceanomicrobium pacificus]
MSAAMLTPEQTLLIAKVLKLHYEEGHPQSEIAKDLRLSTAKVNRLIKQGRDLGMVQITIKTPLMRLFDLEARLTERWKLHNCIVLPAVTGSPETTLNEVGRGAASLLLDNLRDGDQIAISGGKTLSAIIANVAPNRTYDVNVVPATGGVQGHHYTDVNHIATELANRLSARATLIHAPLHAESPKERDMVMSVKSVQSVMDQAGQAAVALVGVGAVAGENPTYYEAHPVSASERKALYDGGVRGEFLGHLIEADGALSAHPFNSRLVALSPARLKNVPVAIGVASGREKVEPIRAVLNGGYINALVTDENTATAILEKEPEDA